jgi:hypothetical protein
MVLSARHLLDILALLFAIGSLAIGGIVLLSIEHADAIIIGLHEVTLAIAVILHITGSFIPGPQGGAT